MTAVASRNLLLSASLALAGCWLGACDAGAADPSSRVDGPRILAIAAEPPVVTQGQDAAVVPLIAGLGPEQRATLSVRACDPWRAIANPQVDCGPDHSLVLEPEDFALGPGARFSTSELLAAFPPPAWYEPDAAPAGGGSAPWCPASSYAHVAVTVVLEASLDPAGADPDARTLVATKRIRVTLDPVSRKNPIIADLVLGDQPSPASFVPDTTYTISASPSRASLDARCDQDDRPIFEPVRIYLYSDAGQLAEPFIDVAYTAEGQEDATPTTWLAPASGPASIWAVALDDDGGVGWRRFDMSPR